MQEGFWRRLIEEGQEGVWVHDEEWRTLYVNKALARMLGAEVEWFKPEVTPVDVFFEEDREEGLRLMRQHMREGSGQVVFRFRKRDGTAMWAKVAARLLPYGDGAGNAMASLYTDVTDLELARRKHSETAASRAEMLEIVVDNVPVMITVYDEVGRIEVVNREVTKVLGWTLEDARSGELMEKCYRDEEARRVALEFMMNGTGWRDFALWTRDGEVVETTWAKSRLSDGRHVGIGLDLRERVANARRLAQSEAELRALAERLTRTQENDMRALARELHDDISQRLAGVSMELAALERGGERRTKEGKERLGRLAELVVDLSNDVHGLSRRLHPSMLDVLGLRAALEAECQRVGETEGLKVEFVWELEGEGAKGEAALCLYRIAQEGLRNAARHSGSARVRVRVERETNWVVLEVRDWGRGFETAAARRAGGLGLVSMTERARTAGGEMEVDAKQGEGVAIRVRIPAWAGAS